MEKKTKKELIALAEEQSNCLQKYKSRLHDVVESYKHLVKEKEALEKSINALTEARSILTTVEDDASETDNASEIDKHSSEKRNDDCLQMLKSSLEALTIEKSRIENELRTDRKKILQQKDELERAIIRNENKWLLEREKYENVLQELKKKVSAQQREREKEQQDHVLMLKELQNLLANERALKDKLEEQICDMQQQYNSKLSEKKAMEYEKCIEELQYKLRTSQDRLKISENKNKESGIILQKLQEELDDVKVQYLADVDVEKNRADMAEERLKLLNIVNEKRIANLESRISELSSVVGNYDKLHQDDQLTIQRLKERVAQLQIECAAISKVSLEESKFWEYGETDIKFKELQDNEKDGVSDNLHAHCHAELLQLRDELEQCKSKAESALKEKYSKTSAALLSDAKAGKEIKELKSKLTQLQDQLQTSKSQLQLNEEYHNKVTTNLEKFTEELKLQHKQELTQMEMVHKAKLMELEYQILKQRERTLALLDEKDKEICLLKSSFLSSFIKKDKSAENNMSYDTEASTSEQEAAANLLSNSLISSKKDGHILHYIQELSRKDVEISNLRHARVQTESILRKLQQDSSVMEEKYSQEVEALKSRIKLLESNQNEDGTNVEYLKNVVLRFLKCNDPKSRRHMVNAIATILHFTSSEIKDVKASIKALK